MKWLVQTCSPHAIGRGILTVHPDLAPPLQSSSCQIACLRSLSRWPRRLIKMHSFPPSNGLPSSVQLCDSINHIIEDYIHSHASPSQADIRPFHGEIQHLRKFLDLLDKVKNAGGPLLDEEESHLHDVNRLLRRCHRTLSGLHTTLKGVRHPDAHTNGHEEPWNLNTPTFTVPRSYISFYRRTLEMSLMGIHL